jgi:predicted acylesterase/phospholipase RssA
MTERRKTVRGLVLAGGGAKGAFQFGELKALAECGIEFDFVAGTSVGALKAALWSCGQLESGERFWREVTYSEVYPPRFQAFRRLPPRMCYWLMVAHIAVNMLARTLLKQPLYPPIESHRPDTRG